MEQLLKKLNFTNQHHTLLVNVPAELSPLTKAFDASAMVSQDPTTATQADFVMAFVQRLDQVEQMAAWIAAHTESDTIAWMVYPKQSSKNYQCEFNRDTGWASLGEAGFEPVRIVAVNEDWSALRFRRVTFVKKMTRDPKEALSTVGKTRTAGV